MSGVSDLDSIPHAARSDKRIPKETSEVRFDRLLTETEALAGRLSTVGPTLDVKRLSELTDKYSGLLLELRAAEDEWLQAVWSELSVSSA